jgi:ribonuclease HI
MPKVAKPRRSAAPLKKCYALARVDGGVEYYDTWPECKQRVKKARGSFGRGFRTPADRDRWAAKKRAQTRPALHIVHTDGAFEGGVGGMGVYWGFEHELNRSTPMRRDDKHTNNRAELLAIRIALEQWRDNRDRLDGVLLLRTDSMYSLNTLVHYYAEWVDPDVPEKSVDGKENLDIIGPLYELFQSIRDTVVLEHVKGHADNPGNDEADRLAGEASRAAAVERKQ